MAEWSSGANPPRSRRLPGGGILPRLQLPAPQSALPSAREKRFTSPQPDARGRQNTRRLSRNLDNAGVKPPYPALRTDGGPANDVETRIFRNGELTIVALQRDYRPSSNPDNRETVVLVLPRMLSVYDLWARQLLGNTNRLELELGPVEPVLLSLSQKPIAPPSIAGPRLAHLGEIAEFHIRSNSPAKQGVIHLDVADPEGGTIAHYSENLVVDGGETTKVLPFALNDKTGVWKLRATDLPSGGTATAELQVAP